MRPNRDPCAFQRTRDRQRQGSGWSDRRAVKEESAHARRARRPPASRPDWRRYWRCRECVPRPYGIALRCCVGRVLEGDFVEGRMSANRRSVCPVKPLDHGLPCSSGLGLTVVGCPRSLAPTTPSAVDGFWRRFWCGSAAFAAVLGTDDVLSPRCLGTSAQLGRKHSKDPLVWPLVRQFDRQ